MRDEKDEQWNSEPRPISPSSPLPHCVLLHDVHIFWTSASTLRWQQFQNEHDECTCKENVVILGGLNNVKYHLFSIYRASSQHCHTSHLVTVLLRICFIRITAESLISRVSGTFRLL